MRRSLRERPCLKVDRSFVRKIQSDIHLPLNNSLFLYVRVQKKRERKRDREKENMRVYVYEDGVGRSVVAVLDQYAPFSRIEDACAAIGAEPQGRPIREPREPRVRTTTVTRVTVRSQSKLESQTSKQQYRHQQHHQHQYQYQYQQQQQQQRQRQEKQQQQENNSNGSNRINVDKTIIIRGCILRTYGVCMCVCECIEKRFSSGLHRQHIDNFFLEVETSTIVYEKRRETSFL